MKPTLSSLRLFPVLAFAALLSWPVIGKKEEPQANLLFMKGRQLVLEGEYEKAIPLLEKAIVGDPENAFINHQLSELYLRTGKLERAEVLARKALEKDSANVEYLATLGGILAANRKFDEAKEQYAKINSLDPGNQKAGLLIGILEAEAGNLDAGAKTLTKAIEESEENFMAYFYRAKIYLEMEEIEKAKADLAKCQSLRPGFVEAGTALGLLYEKLGESDQAIKAYSQIRGNGRFRKRLAQLYLQNNQFDKALSELLEYEQIESDDYTTKVKIGLLFFELKKFDDAKERFLTILKEQPEADNVRFYLGAVYEEVKDWTAALKNFRKVTKDSSFYKEAMLHIGFIHRQRMKYDEGIAFTKQIIKASPEIPEFYDMQASFHESKRDYKEAMAVLGEGLKKFPADEKLTYFQGAIYERLGDRAKAINSMKGILEKNPQNAHALNFLGYTYTESGQNLEEAEGYIRKALELRPEDGFIEDSLGWVLFKQGKVEQALERLERAMKLQPEESVIYEHLGDIYFDQKAFTKAAVAYQKAYQLIASRDKDQAKKIQEKLGKIPSGAEVATKEAR